MAIQGLEYGRKIVVPNVSDDVGASLEALAILGWNGDQEQARESITTDFQRLELGQKRPGENYIQVPLSDSFTLASMVAAIDRVTYKDGRTFPRTYLADRIWTPGRYGHGETYGCNIEQMNSLGLSTDEPANWSMHARRALTDGPNDSAPLLHFLNMPLDNKYLNKDKDQIRALARAQAVYATEAPDFNLGALNPAGYCMLALMHRIKGKLLPMQGFSARFPQLGEAMIDDYRVAGGFGLQKDTGSNQRLIFASPQDAVGDGAHPNRGVGLSVGDNQDLGLVHDRQPPSLT